MERHQVRLLGLFQIVDRHFGLAQVAGAFLVRLFCIQSYPHR